MSATETQAVDQMHALLKTAWDADASVIAGSYPMLYEDRGDQRPTDGEGAWGYVYIRETLCRERGIGSDGIRRFTSLGLVTVQLFTPQGDGWTLSDSLAEMVRTAFRGKRTSGGVIFRNIRARKIGASGPWMHKNVFVEYEYDTVA